MRTTLFVTAATPQLLRCRLSRNISHDKVQTMPPVPKTARACIWNRRGTSPRTCSIRSPAAASASHICMTLCPSADVHTESGLSFDLHNPNHLPHESRPFLFCANMSSCDDVAGIPRVSALQHFNRSLDGAKRLIDNVIPQARRVQTSRQSKQRHSSSLRVMQMSCQDSMHVGHLLVAPLCVLRSSNTL